MRQEIFHPLRKTPWTELFPYLTCACLFKKGKDANDENSGEQGNAAAMKLKMKMGGEAKNPLIILGPGINAYHTFLQMLFFIFLILYILHLPLMASFAEYNFYGGDEEVGGFASNSISQLGYSKTECVNHDFRNPDNLGNASFTATNEMIRA